MYKLVETNAYSDEFMASLRANGDMITTLINTDAGVKSAASNAISRSIIAEHRPTNKNEFLVHIIGVGDGEYYGYNKNGDYFGQEPMSKYASTFVSHGCVYREHRNKNPHTQGIGKIAHAVHDPVMKRTELLVILDKNKAAEEYEMAKEAKELNWSMSCRVPNDRCSCCGSEAKTISNYCDCLRYNMGQWMPEFKKYAFAYNDKPTFFDMSRVKNPADRIARYLEYVFPEGSDMSKAANVASGNILIPSTFLAKEAGFEDRETLLELSIPEQLTLTKLASAEDAFASINPDNIYTDSKTNAYMTTYPFSMMESLNQREIDTLRTVQPETLNREFAKRAAMLSFPAFVQYVSGSEDVTDSPIFKHAAAIMLPGSFSRMMHAGCMRPFMDYGEMASHHQADHDPGNNGEVQSVMDEMERKFSIKPERTVTRIQITICSASSDKDVVGEYEKSASYTTVSNDAQILASTYAHYQLKMLENIRSFQDIDDRYYDQVAGANTVRVFNR